MKLAAALVALFTFAGCDETPVALPACQDDKPLASTFTYACADGTRRCTFADGSMRFAGCVFAIGAEQVECVEACE